MNGGYVCPICGSWVTIGEFHGHLSLLCEHDFHEDMSNQTSSGTARKWRCRKCLEVRYTYD